MPRKARLVAGAMMAGAMMAGGITACPSRATVVADVRADSSTCQWWYRNADPAPQVRYLKCVVRGQTIRVDTSGVGQNGGE